jgi:hypothetical protein
MAPTPLGYEAPIRLGTWQRMLAYGAPRLYSYSWLIACIWLGLACLLYVGQVWALAVAGVWVVGQGLLIGVTYWNINFDSALLNRLRRRYQRHYRAG